MKLTVAYLGGPFHGWQRQPGRPTVQGELEAAIRSMTKREAVAVVGAGRTDAGVHAAGQVAHVELPSTLPPSNLKSAVNGILPSAIRVRAAVRAATSFHARHSALGKIYCYRLRWRESTLPWNQQRCATVPAMPDVAAITAAVSLLPGRRDMATFTVPEAAEKNTLRSLFRVTALPRREGLDLVFVGDGFLRYQVRRMVGALLELGWGRLSLTEFRRLLEIPSPGAPLWTAPAAGLTLERVLYRRSRLLPIG
jgi:tRNA pseudouridine38-40 synthase